MLFILGKWSLKYFSKIANAKTALTISEKWDHFLSHFWEMNPFKYVDPGPCKTFMLEIFVKSFLQKAPS